MNSVPPLRDPLVKFLNAFHCLLAAGAFNSGVGDFCASNGSNLSTRRKLGGCIRPSRRVEEHERAGVLGGPPISKWSSPPLASRYTVRFPHLLHARVAGTASKPQIARPAGKQRFLRFMSGERKACWKNQSPVTQFAIKGAPGRWPKIPPQTGFLKRFLKNFHPVRFAARRRGRHWPARKNLGAVGPETCGGFWARISDCGARTLRQSVPSAAAGYPVPMGHPPFEQPLDPRWTIWWRN